MRHNIGIEITVENHKRLLPILRSIPIFIEHRIFDSYGAGVTTNLIGKFAGNVDFGISGILKGTDEMDELWNVLYYGESSFAGGSYFCDESIPLRMTDEDAELLIATLKNAENG